MGVSPARFRSKRFEPQGVDILTSVLSQHDGIIAKLIGTPDALKIEVTRSGKSPRIVALPETMAQINTIVWPLKDRAAVLGC